MEEMAGSLGKYEYIQELRKMQLQLNVCLHFVDIGEECVDNLPIDNE